MNKYINNTYKKVRGITIIDSGKPGPNLGILALTHGNEPVGIDVFSYLEKQISIAENLQKGKIYFIVVNIQAYQNYLQQTNPLKYRFIEEDMNRILHSSSNTIEKRRFDELKPIFDELDVAIDLHTMSVGTESIGITEYEYMDIARDVFDIDLLLECNTKETGLILGYMRKDTEIFALECGLHKSNKSIETGLRNIMNLFFYKEMLNGDIEKNIKSRFVYRFLEEIVPLGDNFRFSHDYENFQALKKGEIFAVDSYQNYINKFGSKIHLGLMSKENKKGVSAGFLFENLN